MASIGRLTSLNLLSVFTRESVFSTKNAFNVCSIRNTTTKHYHPKWKLLRHRKFIRVDLPKFDKRGRENLSKEEMRSEMKHRGVLPPRYWRKPPIFVTCTYQVSDPYVPPEGDGIHAQTKWLASKNIATKATKSGQSWLAFRKIKKFEENFSNETFLTEAQDLYIKAHNTLMMKDPDKLTEYATEYALHHMLDNVENKTIKWDFIKSLEPPRIVHARAFDLGDKMKCFAQVTVRFHTQQILAIYDRFGRLVYGSEVVAKDVLEYVVFEKFLSNYYGTWRLHHKISPPWLPPSERPAKTFVMGHADKAEYYEKELLKSLGDEADTTESEVISVEKSSQ